MTGDGGMPEAVPASSIPQVDKVPPSPYDQLLNDSTYVKAAAHMDSEAAELSRRLAFDPDTALPFIRNALCEAWMDGHAQGSNEGYDAGVEAGGEGLYTEKELQKMIREELDSARDRI